MSGDILTNDLMNGRSFELRDFECDLLKRDISCATL